MTDRVKYSSITSFPTMPVIGAVLLSALAFGFLSWAIYDGYRFTELTKTRYIVLTQLRGKVLLYDETLTMSARMAAATGDVEWIERYQIFEPLLDAAIEDSIALSKNEDMAAAAKETASANAKLVAMEEAAFSLIRGGRLPEAQALLFSETYREQKRIYADGMGKLVRLLEAEVLGRVYDHRNELILTITIAAAAIFISLIEWIFVFRRVNRWRTLLSTNLKDLAWAEEDLSRAQRQGRIGNWRWDVPEERLVSCSTEYARIHGATIEEMPALMAAQIERIIHPDDRERIEAEFQRIDEKGIDYEIEYRIVRPDGIVRHVLEIGETILDDDRQAVLQTGTVQDITERKLIELELLDAKNHLEEHGHELQELADHLMLARDQARSASKAKSEFLSAVSHELRTPLNAVIGFSALIRDESLGPVGSVKYRDFATDIHSSGQHLLELINDILDLSRADAGTEELREEDIEIHGVIDSAVRSVIGRAQKGRIELEIDTSEDIPRLRGDRGKLRQILVNLLSNGIKFTDEGGRVKVRAWCRKDSGHVVQIIDTGIGIALDDIPKALAPFQQVDSELGRKYEGTGLGLPLTKALVELHGGILDLQSKVDVGTTVTVRFPAERIRHSAHDTKAIDTIGRKAG